jgi:hypothetical protein
MTYREPHAERQQCLVYDFHGRGSKTHDHNFAIVCRYHCFPTSEAIMDRRAVGLFALVLVAGGARGSEPFFPLCTQVLDKPAYAQIAGYRAAHADMPHPNRCFRLDDREFLLSFKAAGDAWEGLYYFDARKQKLERPDGYQREEVEVVQEFDGPNGKHLAIISSTFRQGMSQEITYEAVYLKPRAEGRTFELQRLLSTQGVADADPCSARMRDGEATAVTSVIVEGAGTQDATLVFNLKSRQCPNGEVKNVARRFRWNGRAFADEVGKFTYAGPAGTTHSCYFEGLQLPKDLHVYAAGGYSGRSLDFQIDTSGHDASQFDVVVNSAQPVALMLGAYEPTIWNIGWTRSTRIVAVVMSGYHRQVVAGLDSAVPLIYSSNDNGSPCGHYYVSRGDTTLDPHARRMFNRPVDLTFTADREGHIVVGDPLPDNADLVTSPARKPESYRDFNAPLGGIRGVEDAVAKGLLRPATEEDLRAGNSTNLPLALHRTFVALKGFRFPSGLYGANAVTIIVPPGVPRPSGEPGHSSVYDLNTAECLGVTCRR